MDLDRVGLGRELPYNDPAVTNEDLQDEGLVRAEDLNIDPLMSVSKLFFI